MIRLGVVADDLTGATTAAALFARSGISAIAYRDLKSAEKAGPADAEALLLSTGSRAMKAEDAYNAVSRACTLLRGWGASRFQKRIDTTLRGSIGSEIDAMLDVLGEDCLAVVVPSMPQNHRIVVGGYSLIDGNLLARTEVRNDVRTPVNESFIPRLLSGQTRRPVAQLTAECLTEGPGGVAEGLKNLYNQGVRIVVVDAVTMDDIRMIADACHRLRIPVLSVDPGPFTTCLINGYAEKQHETVSVPAEGTGTVLVAVGSTTVHSRRQIDVLCKDPQTERVVIHPECFLQDGEACNAEVSRAAEEAIALLKRTPAPRAVVLDTATEASQFGTEEEQQRDDARAANGEDPVVDNLGRILRIILSDPERVSGLAGLYVTGGDTMAAILAQLEVSCVRVHDYIVPQVDLCRIVGGALNGMVVASKGGLVGDDQIALLIVKKILEEAAREKFSAEEAATDAG